MTTRETALGRVQVADFVPHTAPCPPGLDGYRAYKCRCDEGCKAANTKYGRDRRARIKKEQQDVQTPDNVRPLRRGNPMTTVVGGDVLNGRAPERPPERCGPGVVEKSVIDVCVANSVADDRPDLVMQARTLARLMDNPEREKEWTPASKQLSNLMAQLCPVTKTKSRGRLVAIKKMTNRRPPGEVRDDRAQS